MQPKTSVKSTNKSIQTAKKISKSLTKTNMKSAQRMKKSK